MHLTREKELEVTIYRAIRKVNGDKENDLCKYLPAVSGEKGHMHHFTFQKMKSSEPERLVASIKQFILNPEYPVKLSPKQRAARGSQKKSDHMVFTKSQLEKLLDMAREAGDPEMIQILSPKKSFAQHKRILIQSIRQGKVEPELWNNYTEAANAQQQHYQSVAPVSMENTIFER